MYLFEYRIWNMLYLAGFLSLARGPAVSNTPRTRQPTEKNSTLSIVVMVLGHDHALKPDSPRDRKNRVAAYCIWNIVEQVFSRKIKVEKSPLFCKKLFGKRL